MLVGHSYGGAVISNVDADAGKIAGLVYVAGFAPEAGESAITLSSRCPAARSPTRSNRSRVATARPTCTIRADASRTSSRRTCPHPGRLGWRQRSGPSRRRRSVEPSGRARCGRAAVVVLFGEQDRNIPAALAALHGQARRRPPDGRDPGASHAVAVSHPVATAPPDPRSRRRARRRLNRGYRPEPPVGRTGQGLGTTRRRRSARCGSVAAMNTINDAHPSLTGAQGRRGDRRCERRRPSRPGARGGHPARAVGLPAVLHPRGCRGRPGHRDLRARRGAWWSRSRRRVWLVRRVRAHHREHRSTLFLHRVRP